jgi:Zn-dependent protease
MINILFENPLLFFISAIGLTIAITVHEFAHAWSADRLGDPTPRLQGRVTLNPLKHLDPIGTLFILFIGFGWGRPVEFDPFNLRDMRRDAAIISFAGPLSNIIMAVLAGLISFGFAAAGMLSPIMAPIIYLFIYMNIGLAVFNMIPIHPLDGFKIVGGLLSKEKAHDWYALERYGFIFLLVIIMPIANGNSVINIVIRPVVNFIAGLFAGHLV